MPSPSNTVSTRSSPPLSMLVRAVERTGQDATVHEHLGDVYFKLGKTKEAISQWQLSVKQFQAGIQADADPEGLAQVNKKLDAARIRNRALDDTLQS